jgi:hypothetical protein
MVLRHAFKPIPKPLACASKRVRAPHLSRTYRTDKQEGVVRLRERPASTEDDREHDGVGDEETGTRSLIRLVPRIIGVRAERCYLYLHPHVERQCGEESLQLVLIVSTP